MATENLFTTIKETLECSLCMELYDNPGVLSCGHIFCKYRCLKPIYSKNSKDITCPSCRHTSSFKNADAIPIAYDILKTLAALSNAQPLSKKSDNDDQVCSDHGCKIFLHCLTCSVDVCNMCVDETHVRHSFESVKARYHRELITLYEEQEVKHRINILETEILDVRELMGDLENVRRSLDGQLATLINKRDVLREISESKDLQVMLHDASRVRKETVERLKEAMKPRQISQSHEEEERLINKGKFFLGQNSEAGSLDYTSISDYDEEYLIQEQSTTQKASKITIPNGQIPFKAFLRGNYLYILYDDGTFERRTLSRTNHTDGYLILVDLILFECETAVNQMDVSFTEDPRIKVILEGSEHVLTLDEDMLECESKQELGHRILQKNEINFCNYLTGAGEWIIFNGRRIEVKRDHAIVVAFSIDIDECPVRKISATERMIIFGHENGQLSVYKRKRGGKHTLKESKSTLGNGMFAAIYVADSLVIAYSKYPGIVHFENLNTSKNTSIAFGHGAIPFDFDMNDVEKKVLLLWASQNEPGTMVIQDCTDIIISIK